MKNFFSRHWFLILVIFAGAFLRVLYTQFQLDPLINDNAKNAWEASRFFNDFNWQTILKIPSHLEIFSWAILFQVFGQNTFSYNLLSIIQYFIFAIFFFLTIQKFSNYKIAFLASLLIAFAPPFFIFNSLMWSGHFRGVMFAWIIFYLFSLLWEKWNFKLFLFLILFSGFATALGKIVPGLALLASVILLFFQQRKNFSVMARSCLDRNWKILFSLVFVFAIGFLLFYDFTSPRELVVYQSLAQTNFYNLNLFFFKKFIRIIEVSFLYLGNTQSYNLFFGWQNGIAKIIYIAVFSAATLFWFIFHFKKWREKDFVLVIFLIFFTFAFAFFNLSHGITRYYLPFLPIFIYFLADVLARLRAACFVFCFLFLSFSLFNNLHFYHSYYQPIYQIIDFAETNKIENIFTDYHKQFALIFYSDEKIAASSLFLTPDKIGKDWDKKVEDAKEISYLFDGENKSFEDLLTNEKIIFQKQGFDNYILYYHLSRRFPPSRL